MGVMATPQGFLLPVLGILLVTQEWSQRTGDGDLHPRAAPRQGDRGRRSSPRWSFGLLAVVLALVLAALVTAVSGAPDAWENIGLDDVGKFALLQVSGVLQGLAFGLIFLNSAAAIVTYFVLPIAFSIVTSIWTALEDVAALDRPGHLAAALVQRRQPDRRGVGAAPRRHPDLGGAAVRGRHCGGCCAPS